MSRTYPKSGDSDPAAAERAQLRQFTRELHEAAQNAREAARELAAARGDTEKTAAAVIDQVIETHVNKNLADLHVHLLEQTAILNQRIDTVANEAQAAIDKIEDVAKRTEARLAGYSDADEVTAMLMKGINGAVRDLSTEVLFIDDVARCLAEHFDAVVSGKGAVLKRRG